MNIRTAIEMALFLLEGVARFTQRTADEKIIAEIRAAIAAVNQVRGSLVTKEQLEGLRTKIEWPEIPAPGGSVPMNTDLAE